ncbi:MAG: hypothetical protein H0V43_10940 [Gemmatimonadales bacterium]|nr:hypothetical protein [Gemmatimonadales bacterium]MBA3554008.1 hypothetical protein [Gemmatimonadales bacterium]
MRPLGVIVCLLAPSAARAQLPPVGVPPGVARVELDGAFDIWDDRFVDGTREPLSAGLVTSSLGATLLASLAGAEARIRGITGITDYRISLGEVGADVLAERGTAMFGLSLGLTRSLTVFGRIPLVRARVQQTVAVDPTGANVGPAPEVAGQDPFFQQFDDALSTLAAQLAAGAYDADPAQRALAQSTLDAGGTLRSELFLLLADAETASPFVPTASSEAGAAIVGRIGALQTTLATSLGVPGFSAAPSLPAAVVAESDLESFIGDPGGPVGLQLEGSIVTFRGDAEGGVSYTLADRWDRGTSRGGLRAAVEGLVRFPTGVVARTDRTFALGTGDGQTDVELRGTVDLGSGPWGARFEAGYNRQFAANYLESLAPPVFTIVRRDPGDVVTLAVRPFFRIARTFALIGALEHQSRGRDDVTYASDAGAIPGVDPDLLAEGTDARATLLALGVTYANPGALRPGGRGLPVDAGWSYERVLIAGGGVVADVHRVRARFRVYIGVF